jgi:hypothetical protein
VAVGVFRRGPPRASFGKKSRRRVTGSVLFFRLPAVMRIRCRSAVMAASTPHPPPLSPERARGDGMYGDYSSEVCSQNGRKEMPGRSEGRSGNVSWRAFRSPNPSPPRRWRGVPNARRRKFRDSSKC